MKNCSELSQYPIEFQNVVVAAIANAKRAAIAIREEMKNNGDEDYASDYWDPENYANERVYYGRSTDCYCKNIEPPELFICDNYL